MIIKNNKHLIQIDIKENRRRKRKLLGKSKSKYKVDDGNNKKLVNFS